MSPIIVIEIIGIFDVGPIVDRIWGPTRLFVGTAFGTSQGITGNFGAASRADEVIG
jgi:hypothetical protein